MAKKTKRKIAHPKLPMQRHLNLQHEGRYFDLRTNFDRLNERYFGGKLRGYKVTWGRKRKRRPKEYFISAPSRKKTASSGSIRSSISLSCRRGSFVTFFNPKCFMRW